MNACSRKLLLASGLALALTSLGCSGMDGSNAQTIADARQEGQIWTTYALSPYLRANNLVALVQSGRVRLTGIVAEFAEKDLADAIATEVTGVQNVDNQIVVQPGYVPTKTTRMRSFGEAMDDAAVTFEVRSKLAWSKSLQGLQALVDTTQGRVRLRGVANSQSAKALAGRLAETTRTVTAVDNQLTVTGVPAFRPEDSSGPVIDDAWITAKVRSTLLYSLNAAAADISVSTLGGDVILSGRAKSGAERALAIELAQNVRGVRSVNLQGYTF